MFACHDARSGPLTHCAGGCRVGDLAYSVRAEYVHPTEWKEFERRKYSVRCGSHAGCFGANRDVRGLDAVAEVECGFELPMMPDAPKGRARPLSGGVPVRLRRPQMDPRAGRAVLIRPFWEGARTLPIGRNGNRSLLAVDGDLVQSREPRALAIGATRRRRIGPTGAPQFGT